MHALTKEDVLLMKNASIKHDSTDVITICILVHQYISPRCLKHSPQVAGSNPALTEWWDSSTVEHYSWEVG